MSYGPLPVTAYSVMVPPGVIIPMLLPLPSVNHKLPSRPVVMVYGQADLVGTTYSVIAPEWGAVRKGLAARLERPSGGRDAHDPA